MSPKTYKPAPLPVKLAALARSPQFFWFLGHATSVVLFLTLQIVLFFTRPLSTILYRLILVSELVSYGIVAKLLGLLKKSVFKMQSIHDENVQYVGFAVVLFLTSFKLGPWSKALYSYVIFSFFHAIVYFQANLLEVMPMSLAAQAAWSDRITFMSSNYNQQALYFASMNEVFLVMDFLWAVPAILFRIFRDPVYILYQAVLMFAVAVFLKLRYAHSAYTRNILMQLDAKVTGLLSHPVVPSALLQFYAVNFKGMVLWITEMIPTPTQVSKKTQ
ncbi:hypothetical protein METBISCDRAFT_17171 [Metschnikowia bicuspidata]|uniref:Uncharacterized protein n=1 Tax=Metschnikowia bicuspidata TaxID=27322 RepID=A0A4P9ZBL2_9ASCO|nr:hypothetical protein METBISCDRAFT_17171 [Metschnikowia bicuspidata]